MVPADERDLPAIDALLAAGRYAEAAVELRRVGRLAEAQSVYERIWDFRAAADVARERGDRPELLRLLLQAREMGAAAQLKEALRGARPEEQARAADVYERQRMWSEAAALRESLGELDRARALYLKAQAPLDAARLDEVLGNERAAGLIYERVLAEDPRSPDAARAHLALGRLLGRFGRFDEAVRHLQHAVRSGEPALLPRAQRLLVSSLAALGYRDAADLTLNGLRRADPRLPELDPFLAGEQAARPATGGARLGGRYSVLRLLGSGGMGRVYLARDELTGREVAVKVVAPPVDERGHAGYARFVREARVVSSLRHPHIVSVGDFHEVDGLLAMEYMAGGTLADRLPQPMAPAQVRRLVLEVAAGLEAAHAHGVVHRDLKPANLFFSAAGEAKIGDFGVAHLQDLGATQTAGFIGTIAYMSPEQISGATLSFAADIYALGVTTFQALTGQLPFRGPDFVGQHLGEPPPRPSSLRPGLEAGWDAVVARMLEKDPAARFASLDALRRAVEGLGGDEGGRAATAVAAPELEPAAAATPSRYQARAQLESTGAGELTLAVDIRLGREVLLEELTAAYATTPAGQEHLRWLRTMARLGGPQLQRILRLRPGDGGGLTVVFEAIAAPAADLSRAGREAAEQLRALLRPLHAEGVAHGSIERSIAFEPGGVVLLLAGRRPTGRTVAEEQKQLEALPT